MKKYAVIMGAVLLLGLLVIGCKQQANLIQDKEISQITSGIESYFIVSVSINPQIDFYVSLESGKTIYSDLINEDAKDLVTSEKLELTGIPYAEALESYIKACADQDFLTEDNNNITITTTVNSNKEEDLPTDYDTTIDQVRDAVTEYVNFDIDVIRTIIDKNAQPISSGYDAGNSPTDADNANTTNNSPTTTQDANGNTDANNAPQDPQGTNDGQPSATNDGEAQDVCVPCNGSGLCDLCAGKKTIPCTLVEGAHTWTCTDCNGSGELDCPACHGVGGCAACNATGTATCDKCGGAGCSWCHSTGIMECQTCHGHCKCENCELPNGKIHCPTCAGTGTIICNGCQGTGYVTCVRCNGDGLCPNCHGKGQNGN